jgi:hypothetical protein
MRRLSVSVESLGGHIVPFFAQNTREEVDAVSHIRMLVTLNFTIQRQSLS